MDLLSTLASDPDTLRDILALVIRDAPVGLIAWRLYMKLAAKLDAVALRHVELEKRIRAVEVAMDLTPVEPHRV